MNTYKSIWCYTSASPGLIGTQQSRCVCKVQSRQSSSFLLDCAWFMKWHAVSRMHLQARCYSHKRGTDKKRHLRL